MKLFLIKIAVHLLHFYLNFNYKSSASSSKMTSCTLRFVGWIDGDTDDNDDDWDAVGMVAVGGGGAGGISAIRFNR